ncbi:MAG: MBL fold metallo-hydrolase [Bacteroidota bacterium]
MKTLLLALILVLPAAAQDFSGVEIQTTNLGNGIYMLTGAGGNMGLSVGEDGAFLIDDQFAPLSEKILAAIAEFTDQPVTFVLNTHYHGDHTGGNEAMSGAGAMIVAHDNVRRRMSVTEFNTTFNVEIAAAPEAALPVITFTDEMRFYWNADTLHIKHVEAAHTDGDALVVVRGANVIHAGDLYFSDAYPVIDVSAGGEIAGMIAAADIMLELADDDTRIIPGHGPLSTHADLAAYRAMLADVHQRIQQMVSDGLTMEEVIAAKPTADYDAEWGNGFIPPDQFVSIVFLSLAG